MTVEQMTKLLKMLNDDGYYSEMLRVIEKLPTERRNCCGSRKTRTAVSEVENKYHRLKNSEGRVLNEIAEETVFLTKARNVLKNDKLLSDLMYSRYRRSRKSLADMYLELGKIQLKIYETEKKLGM